MANLFKKVFGGGKAPPQEEEKPEPLVPDHETLQRVARRRAARRTGGRASTVLSEDRLGP
jgi:hypothetical protein